MTKLHHLFDREGVAGYKRESLFLKGRCVLRTPYNEASILDPAGQTRWAGPLDYKENSPIELGQETIAGSPRRSDAQSEVTGTSKAGRHSQDLPSSLDLGQRQPSLDHLFFLGSAESQCVSIATSFLEMASDANECQI